MLDYYLKSDRPTPYVFKCATVIEIDGKQFSYLVDTSIWLSQPILEFLSTPEGFAKYREDVLANYGRDVMDNSGGFAFPYFLDNNGVLGINGVPINDIEDIPQASEKVIKIAHGSPDTHLLNTVLKL